MPCAALLQASVIGIPRDTVHLAKSSNFENYSTSVAMVVTGQVLTCAVLTLHLLGCAAFLRL